MRALVLSGGGAKGAYQVGVLKKWLGEDHNEYDILCGVSVGALSTSFLAMYPTGQEVLAYKELKELWDGIDTSKIYRKWPFFGEAAALWKPAVYDSAPLQTLVRTRLDVARVAASGKKLRVGAVDLASGEYQVFGEDYRHLQEAVLASSAFPAMLLPVWLEGSRWTDGGVRTVTPIQTAVDLGATEIDVVLCACGEQAATIPPNPNALWVAERSIDIMGDQIVADDFQAAAKVNKLVMAGMQMPWWDGVKRQIPLRLVRPMKSLGASLDFSPAKLRAMMEKGYEDAHHPTDGL
jgi:NTE family protein